MTNKAKLYCNRAQVLARFNERAPGIFPLDADVASTMRPLLSPEFVIEQRVGDGPWETKCSYGNDDVLPCERVVWWNRLLRGRRSYRVVVVLGESRSVYFSGGLRNA